MAILRRNNQCSLTKICGSVDKSAVIQQKPSNVY